MSSQGWSKPPPSYPNQTAPDPRHPGQGDGHSVVVPTHSPTILDDIVNYEQTEPTNFWNNVNNFYENYPYLSAFVTVSVKAALADGVAQANELNPKFNPWRNLAFFLYGGLYQGCAQNWIYNVWFPMLFGTSSDFYTVLRKVCFDSLVITTVLCLPSAYILKAMVFQYDLYEAWIRYYTDITENGLFFYYWSLWVPVQCLTFSIVPEHLRILFIAVVSFFWVIILSTVSQKGDQQRNLKMKEEENESKSGSISMTNPANEVRNMSYIKYEKQLTRKPSPRRIINLPTMRGDRSIENTAERQSLTDDV